MHHGANAVGSFGIGWPGRPPQSLAFVQRAGRTPGHSPTHPASPDRPSRFCRGGWQGRLPEDFPPQMLPFLPLHATSSRIPTRIANLGHRVSSRAPTSCAIVGEAARWHLAMSCVNRWCPAWILRPSSGTLTLTFERHRSMPGARNVASLATPPSDRGWLWKIMAFKNLRSVPVHG